MQLVFVHGVNVREGELYDKEVEFRNRNFVDIFFRQLGMDVPIEAIHNPYWGDLGAMTSEDLPFLPKGTYEMLWRKINESEDRKDGDSSLGEDTPLLDIARSESIADVVDLVWDLVAEELLDGKTACEPQRAEESATYMARLAQKALDFGHSDQGQKWLEKAKSDEELVEKLSSLISDQPSLSVPDQARSRSLKQIVKGAGNRLKDRFSTARSLIHSRSTKLGQRLNEDILEARLTVLG